VKRLVRIWLGSRNTRRNFFPGTKNLNAPMTVSVIAPVSKSIPVSKSVPGSDHERGIRIDQPTFHRTTTRNERDVQQDVLAASVVRFKNASTTPSAFGRCPASLRSDPPRFGPNLRNS
jgi:hypothetical protein